MIKYMGFIETLPIDKYLVYRRLQKRLHELPIGFPATTSGVELEILQHLFTVEEAKITFHLSIISEKAKTITRRINSNREFEQDMNSDIISLKLDHLAEKGCIMRNIQRNGEKVYSVAMLAIGIFEFQVEKLSPDFLKLFKQYMKEAFLEEFTAHKPLQLHPVPTEGSIYPDLYIESYDDIRKLIQAEKGPFAVANCVCKQGQDLLGEPCKVTKMREICIIFGRGAEMYKELGWGKEIIKEDLFILLKKAEKDGLVLMPSNTQKPTSICLCCGCCCEVLHNLNPFLKPAEYIVSNYFAEINPEMCISCNRCIKRCQMVAIEKDSTDMIPRINLDRCIGCGICITTCMTHAISLKKKKKISVPPKNQLNLYLKIWNHKVGMGKMLLMLFRQGFGLKI